MLPSKSRAVTYCLFLSTGNVTMVPYALRKNKAVVLLSSQHLNHSVTESEQNKPDMILECNNSKGAVDAADKVLKEYFCHRSSRR